MVIMAQYCKAQFQLASSVPVQLGTDISLNISVTPPTRASIFEPHWKLEFGMEALFN